MRENSLPKKRISQKARVAEFLKQRDNPQSPPPPNLITELESRNDVVGIFAHKILAFQKNIEAAVDLAKNPPSKRCTRFDLLLFKIATGRIQDLPDPLANFSTIQDQLNRRPAYQLSKRQSGYFHCIFPSAIDTFASAVNFANELATVTRFFSDPNKWVEEKGIFKKERLYAAELLNNPEFCRDQNRLRNIGFALDARLDIIRPSDIQQSTQQGADFADSLEALCNNHCLAGITPSFEPVPAPFHFDHDRHFVHVHIPKYMSFDIKRDFPVDIFDLLNRRRVFMMYYCRSSMRPSQINRDLVITKLIELWAAAKKSSQPKSWVYEELNRTFRISRAEGPDDIYRSVRRYLKKLHIQISLLNDGPQ